MMLGTPGAAKTCTKGIEYRSIPSNKKSDIMCRLVNCFELLRGVAIASEARLEFYQESIAVYGFFNNRAQNFMHFWKHKLNKNLQTELYK